MYRVRISRLEDGTPAPSGPRDPSLEAGEFGPQPSGVVWSPCSAVSPQASAFASTCLAGPVVGESAGDAVALPWCEPITVTTRLLSPHPRPLARPASPSRQKSPPSSAVAVAVSTARAPPLPLASAATRAASACSCFACTSSFAASTFRPRDRACSAFAVASRVCLTKCACCAWGSACLIDPPPAKGTTPAARASPGLGRPGALLKDLAALRYILQRVKQEVPASRRAARSCPPAVGTRCSSTCRRTCPG